MVKEGQLCRDFETYNDHHDGKMNLSPTRKNSKNYEK